MKRPKVHRGGKIRSHFEFKQEVYEALRRISEADGRTMLGELTFLVNERARALNVGGQIGKKGGEGGPSGSSVPPSFK